MNVTRHGGVFHRQGFRNSSKCGRSLELHLSRLESCHRLRSTRMTDVMMASTTFSSLESSSQPVVADNVLLTWDGRLDNRSTIARNYNRRPGMDPEDAVLVASAYSTTGPGLWPILIGDYAVACWDASTRQIYLARDPFGTRPLYYYVDDSTVIWCSELSYFIELLGSNADLDDEYMASYLMATELLGKTPYRQISSVQPGCVTVVCSDGVSHRQLWSAASCSDVQLGNDADYEARFRELFAQSVERRLRVSGVAIAELSGGLDSSSIACMADQLLVSHRSGYARIPTVSYVYDGSQGSDERHFITEVAEFRNMGTHVIHDQNMVPLSMAPTAHLPSFADLFKETFKRLRDLVESEDVSVLLSGVGGDEVCLSETSLCPNLNRLFKRGEWWAAFLAAREWALARNTTAVELLWTSGICPLLPVRLQTALVPGTLFPQSWMGPVLIAHLKLLKQHVGHQNVLRSSDPVRRQQCQLLNVAASITSQCYYREQGCCDVAYPFLDRSLIEFLIGIPADQKLRPTQTRSILRRAMKGVLPENVRLRTTKQGPAESMLRALSRDWPNLLNIFRNAEVHKRGYIDGNTFLSDLVRAKHGVCSFTASLARVLALELWLRAAPIDGASLAPKPNANRWAFS